MKRNYTLIELLTVIGVIAILAGLIMPAISMGMVKAKRTKCAANLKQIGAMSMLFSSDRDGYIPLYNKDKTTPYNIVLKKPIEKATKNSSGQYDQKENGTNDKITDATSLSDEQKSLWTAGLLRYAKNDMSLFYCPADEKRRIELFDKDGNSSYSLNYGDANRPGGADGSSLFSRLANARRTPGDIVLIAETTTGKLGLNSLDSKVLNETFKMPAAYDPHKKHYNTLYLDGHCDILRWHLESERNAHVDEKTTDHPNSIFKMEAKKDE